MSSSSVGDVESAYMPLMCYPANKCNVDGLPTKSSTEQIATEQLVQLEFDNSLGKFEPEPPCLARAHHIKFLVDRLERLGPGYIGLDASRPWLVYWCVHGLTLMQHPIADDMRARIIKFLRTCVDMHSGGYGGGPGQMGHLATTYAAVMALCELGGADAWDSIDRAAVQRFVLARRIADGSFSMHESGESDLRAAYTAVSVANLLNIVTEDMFVDTHLWIARCQTYEGGFSASPGAEAHGGYAYCGLAAVRLLGHQALVDADALLHWLAGRQMQFEGGFQGRTNKLVDGCYSFWQGACFPILQEMIGTLDNKEEMLPFLNVRALTEYILYACQHPRGGLVDKPGKGPDLYHTCYVLSGLSLAQHGDDDNEHDKYGLDLLATHPLYNISVSAERATKRHFAGMSPTFPV